MNELMENMANRWLKFHILEGSKDKNVDEAYFQGMSDAIRVFEGYYEFGEDLNRQFIERTFSMNSRILQTL